MSDLLLNNGFSFPLPEDKHVIFFGPNAVGKTQVSLELKKMFERNRPKSSCLLFNQDFITSMIDQSGTTIKPFIADIDSLKSGIKSLCSDFELEAKLTNVIGHISKTKMKELSLSKTSGLLSGAEKVTLSEAPRFSKEHLRKLFVNVSESGKTLLDSIRSFCGAENINNASAESFIGFVSPSATIVQEEVKQGELTRCPVCNNEIGAKEKAFIDDSLSIPHPDADDFVNLSNAYNDPDMKPLLDELLANKTNAGIWLKQLLTGEIDTSIVHFISEQIEKPDADLLNEKIDALNETNKKIKLFSLSDKGGQEKRKKTQAFLDKMCRSYSLPFDATIEKGSITIKTDHSIKWKSLSTAEQHLLCTFYFECLFFEKSLDGPLDIIVDDPFDSYDDSSIENTISLLASAIKETIAMLDNVYIFSHRIDIFALYTGLSGKENTMPIDSKFKARWIDVGSSKSLLLYDASEIAQLANRGISDFSIGRTLLVSYSDNYSLLASAMIYRNCSDFLRKFISTSGEKYERSYDMLSETLIHLRKKKQVRYMLKGIKGCYQTSKRNDADRTSSISVNQVLSAFDEIGIEAFSIKDKNGKSIQNATSLMTYKSLLGLRVRQRFEEALRDKAKSLSAVIPAKTKSVGKILEAIEKQGHTILAYRNFYDSYKGLLNSFCHSSNSKISPSFIYRLCFLQKAREEVEGFF